METSNQILGDQQKKSWKSYFWEFFMLFLAVFCGFLAENLRETQGEKQKAKELARNLYYELQSDSVRLDEVIKFRLSRDTSLSYLKKYFSDSSLENPSNKFYAEFLNGVYGMLSSTFEPKDAVINQLKNSGALVYFKSAKIQKAFADLSLAISNIRQRNQREMIYFNEYNVPFILDHLDTKWLDEITNNGKVQIDSIVRITRENAISQLPKFYNYGSVEKVKAVNWIGYGQLIQRNTIKKYFNVYRDISKKVMHLLREEYDIRDTTE